MCCTPSLPGSVEGHHDSFEDAAVTMQLVKYELDLGGEGSPQLPPPDVKVGIKWRMTFWGAFS